MTQPRRSTHTLPDTLHYHVTVRCAQHAFLSGIDEHTGKDYSHREGWVLERISQLTPVFCIDLCAYAINRKHFELVLHIDRARCAGLTAEEVLQRCSTLLPSLEHFGSSQLGTQRAAAQFLEQRRAQLSDVSCFMHQLNQPLARRANLEDQCTGGFWKAEFKIRALPDAMRLLMAMARVDLSLLRLSSSTRQVCGITSIQSRIQQAYSTPDARSTLQLLEFDTPRSESRADCIPCTFRDYLELLEWTGRKLRADLLGESANRTPYLLQHLALDPETWLAAMQSTLDTAGRATPLRGLRRRARQRSSAEATGGV